MEIKNTNSKKSISDDDEIDFSLLLSLFSRNKILISSIALLFGIFSYIFSLTKKNVWEGRFQIVLDPNEQNQSLSSQFLPNAEILSNFGLNNGNSLKTEVAILESPSVLMPIFEYVQSEKNKIKRNKNININMNYSFINWQNKNLDIKLKKGTSVLNIAYKDSKKSIVIPVLEKISFAYQEYSGKSKKRNISLARTYLNKQIKQYKFKSYKSFKEAQEFAIDQDLTILDVNNSLINDQSIEKKSNNTNKFLNNSILTNIGIENIRVNAANQIRNIDQQLQKIEELSDPKELQYIGSTIPRLLNEGLPQILEDIESKLIELRTKYTEKDKSISKLLEKRDLYISLLKERAIGYLKAQKITTQALMESAMRPKGVILKYKELIREAARDEKTLISLENQLKSINLQEARIEDPWELITIPTLLEKPVAPNRLKLTFFGLILGVLFGFIYALREEKKSGLIFDKKAFDKEYEFKFKEIIKIKDNSKMDFKQTLFKEFIKINSEKNIKCIFVGDLNKFNLKEFQREILNDQKDSEKKNVEFYNVSDQFYKFKKEDFIVFIASIGLTKYQDINSLIKRLEISQLSVDGFILIEDNFS